MSDKYMMPPKKIRSILSVILFSSLFFSCKVDDDNVVVDLDRNIYHSVIIGTQTWMVENLNTTVFSNGDPIPNITNAVDWSNLTTGAYCNYDNDLDYASTYGRLYNWYAVCDFRNIAPAGWHVATESDWEILHSYLGADSLTGGKLKERGTLNWKVQDVKSTNESGFTALPGGNRLDFGDFSSTGLFAGWWSSTEKTALDALMWYIDYNGLMSIWVYNPKIWGLSVRCVKDMVVTSDQSFELKIKPATSIAARYATIECEIVGDSGSLIISRGVCWGKTHNPTVELSAKTNNGSGMGIFTNILSKLLPTTTYYVRAYATCASGTIYSNEESFTTLDAVGILTDIDGNLYHWVTIGNQVWMVENLKVTKYRDGTPIPYVSEERDWNTQSSGAYCHYNNDSTYGRIYGNLYNWYSVNDSRNMAPKGWHVPTSIDWYSLFIFLGGKEVAGVKLKVPGSDNWSMGYYATNESGFSALPGGCRLTGAFSYLKTRGYWWSSSILPSDSSVVMCHFLSYDDEGAYVFFNSIRNGLSVRCVKDN